MQAQRLVQADQRAKALQVRLGVGRRGLGDRRALIGGVVVVDGEGDVADRTGRAVGADEGVDLADNIALVALTGRAAIELDRDDAVFRQAVQFARVGHAVLIGVDPYLQGVEGVGGVDHPVAVEVHQAVVGGADHIIMVAVQQGQLREAGDPGRAAEHLPGVGDLAVAVQVADQEAVARQHPTGAHAIERRIDVEHRRDGRLLGQVEAVAAQVDH